LLLFEKKTTAETHWFISEIYSESALSIKTCEYWFRLFKSDFDLKDNVQINQKKFKDAKLQVLLDKNSAQTLEELAWSIKCW